MQTTIILLLMGLLKFDVKGVTVSSDSIQETKIVSETEEPRVRRHTWTF